MLQSTTTMDTALARRQMVEQQIRTQDVSDPRILAVLKALPRDAFVAPAYRLLAYADAEIPLGHGESMLRPSVEGRILAALALAPGDEVLEIGTGSGYLTACLASLAARVVSVELHPDFVAAAGERLEALGLDNVNVQQHDAGARGLPAGEFDAIVVGASLPGFDERFASGLKPGGRLFIVTGEAPVMHAQLLRRSGNGWQSTSLFETSIARMRNIPEPSRFSF